MPGKFKKITFFALIPVILIALSSCILSTDPFSIDVANIDFTTGEVHVIFRSDFKTSEALSYSWDFGDGSQGSGQVVVHVYSSLGVYLITLTVVTADNTFTFTKTLDLNFGGGTSSSSAPVNTIYWINRIDQTVGRANIDGTNVNNTFIPTASTPHDVVVNDNIRSI